MTANLMGEHARELLGMPDNWEAYKFEVVGDLDKNGNQLYAVTGAVAPIISRGKRKGRRNWRKKDKSTVKTAYITPAQHKDWLKEYERKTGRCHRCDGSGEVFSSWSINNGMTMKQCPRCDGSGKSRNK